jgi:hypothetical protein
MTTPKKKPAITKRTGPTPAQAENQRGAVDSPYHRITYDPYVVEALAAKDARIKELEGQLVKLPRTEQKALCKLLREAQRLVAKVKPLPVEKTEANTRDSGTRISTVE